MGTAYLLLFVVVFSLCCTSGFGQELSMIVNFLEIFVDINDWRSKHGVSHPVPDPFPVTTSDWIFGIVLSLSVVSVAWILAVAFFEYYFKVSLIKLEVAFLPDGNKIGNHIQRIETRANKERGSERKEIMVSEITSCLQDNLESISTSKCWVKCYWRFSKAAENWKYNYLKQWFKMRWEERSIESEAKEKFVVTLLIATKGTYDLPSTSHHRQEETRIALQKIGMTDSFRIVTCDVSCKHEVPKMDISCEHEVPKIDVSCEHELSKIDVSCEHELSKIFR